MSETPTQTVAGLDLFDMFMVERNSAMFEHQENDAPHPGGCDSQWYDPESPLSEPDDRWTCGRSPQHAGLHAAFTDLKSFIETENGLEPVMMPMVVAVWGDFSEVLS